MAAEPKEKSARSASNPAIPVIKARRLSATAEDLKDPSRHTDDGKTSKKSIYRSLRDNKSSRLRPSVLDSDLRNSPPNRPPAPSTLPAAVASPAMPPPTDEFTKKLDTWEKRMQEKKAAEKKGKKEKKEKKDTDKKEKKEKEKQEKKEKEKENKAKLSRSSTTTGTLSPRRVASPAPPSPHHTHQVPSIDAPTAPDNTRDSLSGSPQSVEPRKAPGFLSHLFKGGASGRGSADGRDSLSPAASSNTLSASPMLSPHASATALNERTASPGLRREPSRDLTPGERSGANTPKREPSRDLTTNRRGSRDLTASRRHTSSSADRPLTSPIAVRSGGGTLRGLTAPPSLAMDEFVPLSEDHSLEATTRKRNMVLNELMRTEKDYVRDLYLCRTSCALPMREKGMLNDEESSAIFSNLEMLLAFNTILFNELAAQLSQQHRGDGVGKCFLKLADFLKMYSAYCTNHTQAIARLKQLMEQRPEITAFLAQKTAGELRGHDIESFLIKPIQRLCRYPLLLKEILKSTPETHGDHQALSEALAKINEAVSKVNDFKGKSENALLIAQIQQKVLNAPNLVTPGRRLIREGAIRELCGKEVEKIKGACFYLFTDVLLVARVKEKKQSGWTTSSQPPVTFLKFEDLIPVQIMMLTDLPDGATKNAFEIFCMKLGGQSTRKVFFCMKKEDKEEWIAALQKQAGESLLYEEREEDLEGSRLARPASNGATASDASLASPSTATATAKPSTPTANNSGTGDGSPSVPARATPPVVPPKPKINFVK